MAAEFSKETILTGSVDYLCLACESYLRGAREALQHACSAAHKGNLANTHYVDKYTNDRVRKVRKWYFCEPCNVVLATRAKVRLHVQELKHKENVEKNDIERVGDYIVTGNAVIQEESWHGLIDNNICIICNVEFKNKDDHTSESNHIINLIQSEVSFDCNNIYRKINVESLQIFHCLTCNKVVTGINVHFDDETHKSLLRKSIDLRHSKRDADLNQQAVVITASLQPGQVTDEIDKKIEKITDVEDKADLKESIEISPKETNQVLSDLIDFIPKFQFESIDINFVSETVICRKCSLKLEFRIETIENHIVEHGNNLKIKSSESEPINVNDETTDSKSPTFSDHEHKDTENGKTKTTKPITPDDNDIEEHRNDEKIQICENKPTLFKNKENVETTDSPMLLMSPEFPDHERKDTENGKTETTKPTTPDDSNIREEHRFNEKIKIYEINQTFLENKENDETTDSKMLLVSPAFPDHEPDIEIVESTKIPHEDIESKCNPIQKTAEENGLTYKPNGNKVFCGICYKNVPSSVKNIKEHVYGELHKNNVRLRNGPTNKNQTKSDAVAKKKEVKDCGFQRVPTKHFISMITVVQNIIAQDVVLNRKYCINHLSFQFLTVSGPRRLRCYLCEVNMLAKDAKEHVVAKKHNRGTSEAPVVIHTDSEFIREVRSGQFHCGYCNVVDTWAGMEEHLKSTLHKDNKICANWRLTQYLPTIQEHILIERLFHNDFLMRLFSS